MNYMPPVSNPRLRRRRHRRARIISLSGITAMLIFLIALVPLGWAWRAAHRNARHSRLMDQSQPKTTPPAVPSKS